MLDEVPVLSLPPDPGLHLSPSPPAPSARPVIDDSPCDLESASFSPLPLISPGFPRAEEDGHVRGRKPGPVYYWKMGTCEVADLVQFIA